MACKIRIIDKNSVNYIQFSFLDKQFETLYTL